MINFISFGSGSSGNCYYLFNDEDSLIIDLGVGLRTLKKYFHEYGLQFERIHDILITHDHADHVKSVGSICQKMEVRIYSTQEVHAGIDQNYCIRHKVPFSMRKYVEKNVPFDMGNFHVTPFEVPHDSNDNVGYKIEYKGLVFCIITDAGHVTDDIKQMISDSNYLVIESNHDEEMLEAGPYPQHLKYRISSPYGHLSNRACADALCENATEKLRHVWLCHLSDENNHPELARDTVAQILRAHGIVPGVDFGLDVLRRKAPSEIFELK